MSLLETTWNSLVSPSDVGAMGCSPPRIATHVRVARPRIIKKTIKNPEKITHGGMSELGAIVRMSQNTKTRKHVLDLVITITFAKQPSRPTVGRRSNCDHEIHVYVSATTPVTAVSPY